MCANRRIETRGPSETPILLGAPARHTIYPCHHVSRTVWRVSHPTSHRLGDDSAQQGLRFAVVLQRLTLENTPRLVRINCNFNYLNIDFLCASTGTIATTAIERPSPPNKSFATFCTSLRQLCGSGRIALRRVRTTRPSTVSIYYLAIGIYIIYIFSYYSKCVYTHKRVVTGCKHYIIMFYI